ncbi:hypothetical protein LTR66_006104 [Elasticomyces elasticus]|nr:hypothetical protein LTR50_003794 [Elasticomyces elasticus]KAK4993078.1 hypothetical protein LTR66_006104 [Elasticomyces elasticus]
MEASSILTPGFLAFAGRDVFAALSNAGPGAEYFLLEAQNCGYNRATERLVKRKEEVYERRGCIDKRSAKALAA